jgi:hypothetical protein
MVAMNIVQAVTMAALVAAILAHGAGLWLIYLAARLLAWSSTPAAFLCVKSDGRAAGRHSLR